jgi:hypothetical protein
MVEIKTNKDRTIPENYTESEIAESAAQYLISRGYPVMTDDAYKLSKEIYERNYGTGMTND